MRKRERGLRASGRTWGFEEKFAPEHTERTEKLARRKKRTRRRRGRRGSAEKKRRKGEEKGAGRRGEDGMKRPERRPVCGNEECQAVHPRVSFSGSCILHVCRW